MGIDRFLNSNEYRTLINNFFKEVSDDILIIKGEMYKRNPNAFIRLISERNHLDPISAEGVRKKYEEKYCPSDLFKYFNTAEKLNYLILRSRIDKLLGINGITYNL